MQGKDLPEIDSTDTTQSDEHDVSPQQTSQKPPAKKETSKPLPKETSEEKKARFLAKTIAAINNKNLDEDQKRVLADVILWLPKEEMKPWLGVINNWGNDGVSEMIAEVNGLKLLEATQRRDKLNNLQSNQIPF